MDREVFGNELHTVLRQLYEPRAIRKSPLIAFFNLPQKPDSLQLLRKILIGAIKSLKPNAKAPMESGEYRIYQVLIARFVEQTGQKEVASDLALSERQLRRLESEAVCTLGDILWTQYHQEAAQSSTEDGPVIDKEDIGQQLTSSANSELEIDRLKATFALEKVDINDLVETSLKTILPLFRLLNVREEKHLPEKATLVTSQSGILRQALLNLLTAGAQAAPGGTLRIEVLPGQKTSCVVVTALARYSDNSVIRKEIVDKIELTRQLINAFGGKLEEQTGSPNGGVLLTRLEVPSAYMIRVMVIEDNTDVLKLFERYLSETPYYLIGLSNADQIFSLINDQKPQIIVLDVMMPNTDGWEILGRLREHPATSHIPVIICSIMPQESLAFALGAADYIRKPVRREEFLSALNRQAARLVKGSG
jgi:CheY-like chemotaxis protein